MKWYVLQVLAGQELAVRDALLAKSLCAKVPRELALIHRRGVWIEKEKILIPGYTFVGIGELGGVEAFRDAAYHAIRHISGVIRILGTPKPQAVTEQEADWWLAGEDAAISPSVVRRSDGKPLSGPLVRHADSIVKIDRHRRRARVRVPFLGGEHKTIEFSIILEDSHGCSPQATEETAAEPLGPAGCGPCSQRAVREM